MIWLFLKRCIFGSFQVIRTENKIMTAMETETEMEIKSEREVRKAEEISLGAPSLVLGRNNIITLTIPVVDRNVFSSCMYSVDDDLRYPDIINSEFSSNTITLDPEDLKTDKISAVYECKHRDGRIIVSERSRTIEISNSQNERVASNEDSNTADEVPATNNAGNDNTTAEASPPADPINNNGPIAGTPEENITEETPGGTSGGSNDSSSDSPPSGDGEYPTILVFSEAAPELKGKFDKISDVGIILRDTVFITANQSEYEQEESRTAYAYKAPYRNGEETILLVKFHNGSNDSSNWRLIHMPFNFQEVDEQYLRSRSTDGVIENYFWSDESDVFDDSEYPEFTPRGGVIYDNGVSERDKLVLQMTNQTRNFCDDITDCLNGYYKRIVSKDLVSTNSPDQIAEFGNTGYNRDHKYFTYYKQLQDDSYILFMYHNRHNSYVAYRLTSDPETLGQQDSLGSSSDTGFFPENSEQLVSNDSDYNGDGRQDNLYTLPANDNYNATYSHIVID